MKYDPLAFFSHFLMTKGTKGEHNSSISCSEWDRANGITPNTPFSQENLVLCRVLILLKLFHFEPKVILKLFLNDKKVLFFSKCRKRTLSKL